jgi:hypothetical protein
MVSPIVEKLLTISRNFFHTSYQDDNVLSVSIWVSIIIIVLFFIYLPLAIVSCFMKKRKARSIIGHVITILSVMMCLLVGALIIFLFVMISWGSWYIGFPLLFFFWTVSFLVINRKSDRNLEYEALEEEPVVYDGSKTRLQKVKHSISRFYAAINRGIAERLAFSFIMLIAIGVIAMTASLTTCNVCIAYSPIEFSTSFSRRIFAQGKICNFNEICYSYMTVPQDISTSMIVNYQYYGMTPSDAYVIVTSTTLNGTFEATCFRMENILDEERYQCWADLTNLQPSTTYYYTPSVTLSEHVVTGATRKFRTGPSLTSDEGFTFTTGGDVEWSEGGMELAKKASSESPLFSMVGGDIAYANGDPHCYQRWDAWFTFWQTNMITPDNYSIPILTCIGNHEAGNFRMPISNNGFYLRYFPHQIGLQKVDPQYRPLTHFHRFASHAVLLTMDSWVHLTPAEQTPWINQTLAQFSHLRNKFALYHIAMYASKVNLPENEREIIQEINKEWKPLFDTYELTVGFENHFHCYKTTHPVRNDTVVADFKGTRYLGDGAWGQRSRAHEIFSDIEVMRQVKNEAHVFIIRADSTLTNATSYYWDYQERHVSVLESNLLA